MLERRRDTGTGRWRDREKEGKRDAADELTQCFFSPTLYRSIALSLLLSVSLSLCLPLSTAAHKYHFSFTQLEYNAKEKSVEITLRVFADDLEAALSKHRGKTVKLDDKEAAASVADYVRTKLELKGRDGRVRKLTWIGLEPKVDVAFLYLETKMPEGMTGLQLRQRIFFELFDDQINQVLCKVEDHKTSLDFKPGDSFKMLSFQSK